MKYKTVIEVVCDARDKVEAMHTAGEYLRGNTEPGIIMSSRTKKMFTVNRLREKVSAFL